MSISELSSQRATKTDAGTTTATTLAFPGNVTAGNIIFVYGSRALNGGGSDAFVQGDLTKDSGTAEITDIRIAGNIAGDTGQGFAMSAVWTAKVTTGGSLTVNLAAPASTGTQFLAITEASSTVGWDADANRHEAESSNVVATNNTDIGSGDGSSVGEAMFFGGCVSLSGSSVTGTIDSAFTPIGEDETTGYLGSGFKIVTSSNTDEIFWTLSNNFGSSASLVVAKESAVAPFLPFYPDRQNTLLRM